ncbi:uncharacterized protein LOC117649304 [Thrips palmi]|uniref:Uncharacterized protein LOC117649304 n=1 Tax=Thrips palmi TaxID=161013 RepID=A0A6P8ZRM0_THRPL|nr:uncharacterized protein LOC117649304 [Thrips palmi]
MSKVKEELFLMEGSVPQDANSKVKTEILSPEESTPEVKIEMYTPGICEPNSDSSHVPKVEGETFAPNGFMPQVINSTRSCPYASGKFCRGCSVCKRRNACKKRGWARAYRNENNFAYPSQSNPYVWVRKEDHVSQTAKKEMKYEETTNIVVPEGPNSDHQPNVSHPTDSDELTATDLKFDIEAVIKRETLPEIDPKETKQDDQTAFLKGL